MKTSIRPRAAGLSAACIALFCVILSCLLATPSNADVARLAGVFSYRVIAQFPHDAKHFTQGLEWHDDRFIESSGGYGVSALLEKKRANGETLRAIPLYPGIFAEGITKFRDRLYLLTWRERVALVFDADYQMVERLPYEGEGWGLTNDGRQLIMSNGSAQLSFRDADTFKVTRQVEVRDGEQPVTQLNELEYARGLVFANVWQTSRIAMISPKDGRVVGWLDLSPLVDQLAKPAGWQPTNNVLNGIAYDRKTGHLYVTGKNWPLLFELAIEWPNNAKK